MAEVLCVYCEVQVLKKAATNAFVASSVVLLVHSF